MRENNIAVILSMFFVFCCLLTLGNGAHNEVHAQSVAKGEGDNSPPLLPGGWINGISENFIVINDTQYILTGQTRYPNGRNALKEGEFVRFRMNNGETLSEIFLAEPRQREMYMKPVVRKESNDSVPKDNSIGGEPVGGDKEGGMHLENGVWVN